MWENSLSNTMQNALSTYSKRISYRIPYVIPYKLPATYIPSIYLIEDPMAYGILVPTVYIV